MCLDLNSQLAANTKRWIVWLMTNGAFVNSVHLRYSALAARVSRVFIDCINLAEFECE